MTWLRMARRFARGGTGRLALTVLAVAWGVALVGAVRLANRAVLRAFVEVVDTMAGRAALEVVAGEGGLLPEGVAKDVAGVPGVETAVPSVRAGAFVAGATGELLTVYGVDLTADAPERVYGARLEIDDPVVFLARPDSIALTPSFVAAHGLALGDPVELSTPAGRRTFTVRGLLAGEGVARAYGGNVAVMDVYAAEELFARRGFVTAVDVVVAPDRDVGEVAAAIARRLPAGLAVGAPAQRQADLRRVTESLRIALEALGLSGLVAAFLITFNRLSTMFEERAWQVGVLRAVGARRGAVWRALLGESLLVGAAGVALGLPLGVLLGRLIVPAIATASSVANKLVAPPATFGLDPGTLALAGVLGVVTAVLAAVLPASRAAGVSLADTIRSCGREAPEPAARWAARGVVLAAVGVAFVVAARRTSVGSALVATALGAIGTALTARPAVHAGGNVLAFVARRVAGPVGRFGAASFLHRPRRTALTVATLAVGLGCVVWFWTMAQSFRSSLVDALTAAVRADLVVTSVHVTNGYVEAPVSEDLATRLAAMPGVDAVVASRVVDWPHHGRRIAIEAFDARYFGDPTFGRWPLARERIPDVWERVARGDAVIVSANFLANFGARVGAPVVLATPSGPLTLVVGGVTAAFESPAGTVQMTREVFSRHWGDRQVNRVGLRLAPGADLAAVRTTIGRELGTAYDLRILTARELIGYYATQVGRAFAPLGVLAATVLLVTLLGVADTLLAAVLGRTRELGTARAVGIRRSSLVRMVFAEAVLLAALGVGLGVASGLGLAVLWVRTTLPRLLGWVIDFELPYRDVPVLALLTMAVAGVAALLPARRAARLEPAVALRQE
jgi:putative ABC transport system permease protein